MSMVDEEAFGALTRWAPAAWLGANQRRHVFLPFRCDGNPSSPLEAHLCPLPRRDNGRGVTTATAPAYVLLLPRRFTRHELARR